VVDRREGGVDAVGGGAAHVVDQVGQVLGGLQLDLAVRGVVHFVPVSGRVVELVVGGADVCMVAGLVVFFSGVCLLCRRAVMSCRIVRYH
jgi:hypothetical protein